MTLAMTPSFRLSLIQKAIPLEDKYNLPESNRKFISKGNSPCKQDFSEAKIKRQICDHYLPGIIYITSHYGIFTFEILPSQTHQTPHRKQTEDIELDLSKIFVECSKNIQYQNSQKANLFFAKDLTFLS